MLPVSVVVKVNGLDGDVRVQGIFVKQDSTTSIMGNVEATREALVLKLLNRFLESNHVPFPRNVFFNGTFSASSKSRIPGQDAYTHLLELTVGHAVVDEACEKSVSGHGHHGKLNSFPSSITASYGLDVLVVTRERISSSGRGKATRLGTIPH